MQHHEKRYGSSTFFLLNSNLWILHSWIYFISIEIYDKSYGNIFAGTRGIILN